MTAKEKALLRDFYANGLSLDLLEQTYVPLDVLGVIRKRLAFLEQRKVGRPRTHATDRARWRASAQAYRDRQKATRSAQAFLAGTEWEGAALTMVPPPDVAAQEDVR